MSVPNAGIIAAAENAESKDPPPGPTRQSISDDRIDVARIAPDQFDPRYETSRWEVWAYYSYYVGNNGLSLFNFGTSISIYAEPSTRSLADTNLCFPVPVIPISEKPPLFQNQPVAKHD